MESHLISQTPKKLKEFVKGNNLVFKILILSFFYFCYREADIIRDRIKLILDAGANVVLTTKGIDDLCLKYFVEKNAMAVRRCKKEDLKRIAKATGGSISNQCNEEF